MTTCRFITSVAAATCVAGVAFGQCDVTPPTGATYQNDELYCGSDEASDPNGGCNFGGAWQDLGTLAEGDTAVYGNVGAFTMTDGYETRDMDWYSFTLPLGGTVVYTFSAHTSSGAADPADFVGFIVTGADDCATAGYAGYLFPCDYAHTVTSLAGVHGVALTVNGYGDGGASDCTTDYVLNINYTAAVYDCGDPAQGECIVANGTPGCDDFECCQIVCENDSLCCDEAWDETCVGYAYDLCDYYLYECTDPVAANDCVGDAEAVSVDASNDAVVPFDTTGCNTDGPPEPTCGSGAGFEQLHADLWYLVTCPDLGYLTISTCNGGAEWDTKIAAYFYDAGTFTPQELPELFIGCNEDCGDEYYASSLSFEVPTGLGGGNPGSLTYLVRVGGYGQSEGAGEVTFSFENLPTYVCVPGDDPETTTQSTSMDVVNGSIACAYQSSGISVQNAYARKYMALPAQTIGCSDFGFSNTGSGLIGNYNIYEDASPGEAPDSLLLELIDTKPIYLNGGGYLGLLTVAFETQVEVLDGMNCVFEIDIPESNDGRCDIGCNDLGETGISYFRSDPCGLDWTPLTNWGLYHWAHDFTSWGGGGGETCIGDINEDGIVDGADLTILLGAWGTAEPDADLNGDGLVDGADLTMLLGAWGPCTP